MDLNENQTVVDTEATETLSPSETEGTSSSEVVDGAQDTAADALRREFLEKYGDDEPEEPGESEEDDEAGSAESDDAETSEADTATDTQQSEEDTSAPLEADDAEDDQFRIPDEQFKTLPDGVKKRLGHLNARAKKAERENAEFQAQIEPLQDSHERFTRLNDFVQTNNIEQKNVTVAFDAMAKMSAGDFQGFIDLVQPWYQQAQQALGATIAPDLQQRVDDGYLTEEDAKEMTKARVRADLSEGKAQQLEQRTRERDETTAKEDGKTAVINAINDREAHYKSSDPDYALKSKAIASAIEFAVRGGNVPQTPEQAQKLVDDAHDLVTTQLAPPKRKATPTPPRPSSSNPSQGTAKPANAREAMMLGLRSRPT